MTTPRTRAIVNPNSSHGRTRHNWPKMHQALEAAIGTGGMATVHRARDDRTNTLVALKIVKSDVADPRFDLEARLLASLDDPRIVRYLDHGVDGDVRWIAMEWLDGHDLAVHLRRARPTVAESLGLASDVAFALATAHARGIVHRDLKPANLRVGDHGDVVVVGTCTEVAARFSTRWSGLSATAHRPTWL